ncbi:MAG: 30S ribosome-binding factor RbfA [Bacillota bacterium]
MSQTRIERLNAAFQEEISDILRSETKDPRVGFVSVTRVDLTQDMRQARVYVSVLGPEEDREASLEGLKSAAGFIRSEVARRIRLRYAPEILFRLDDSIVHGVRIMELLNQVKREEGAGRPPAPPGGKPK